MKIIKYIILADYIVLFTMQVNKYSAINNNDYINYLFEHNLNVG